MRSSHTFLFAKDGRTMTSGRQGAPFFSRYGRERVSKPAISLKKCWGGYRSKIRILPRSFQKWGKACEASSDRHIPPSPQLVPPLIATAIVSWRALGVECVRALRGRRLLAATGVSCR